MDGGVPAHRWRSYARGYLALGLVDAAARELAHLTLADLEDTDSVDVLVDVGMEQGNWPAVIDAGRELTQRRPREEKGWVTWAYALREVERVEEARQVLLRAEPLFGSVSAVLQYNLACYECLLGNLGEARRRLVRAIGMHPPFLEDAKSDPDLKDLVASGLLPGEGPQ